MKVYYLEMWDDGCWKLEVGSGKLEVGSQKNGYCDFGYMSKIQSIPNFCKSSQNFGYDFETTSALFIVIFVFNAKGAKAIAIRWS